MGPCQLSLGKHFKYVQQILCLPGAAAGGSCLSLSCRRRHLPASLRQRCRKGNGPCRGTPGGIRKKIPVFHVQLVSSRLTATRECWGKGTMTAVWRGGVWVSFLFHFSGNADVCADEIIFSPRVHDANPRGCGCPTPGSVQVQVGLRTTWLSGKYP